MTLFIRIAPGGCCVAQSFMPKVPAVSDADIENSTELQDQNKMLLLKELGERRKDDVRAAIDINRHQNDLFRKLEEEDEARRRSLLSKI